MITLHWKKFFSAVIAVCLLAFTTHVILTNLLDPSIKQIAQSMKVAQPPYNIFITTFAFITETIPAAVTVLIYYLIQDHLPTQSRVVKGVVFATLILLMNGELIRQPIMNLLVGSPLTLVLLQEINVIVPNVISGILIAMIITNKQGASGKS